MNEREWSKKSSSLLCRFVYGSLLLLLACLGAASLYFSDAFIKKEKERARNYTEMLAHAFDLQYGTMTEEMWSHNYVSMRFRVGEIAANLSKSNYNFVLANELGKCVYSFEGNSGSQTQLEVEKNCEVPQHFQTKIPKFKPGSTDPFVEFDSTLERYVYGVPLYIGNVLTGYLFTSLNDPYQFYRGTRLALVIKIFMLPFSFILFAWLSWLAFSYYRIIKPYLTLMIGMKKSEALAALAAQVAHDIRSPSVALNSVVKNLSYIERDQKKLLTLAASRIEKIANDLLSEFGAVVKRETGSCFLSFVVESIIAEKRAVLGEKSKIEIEAILSDEVQCASIPVKEIEFSRIVSNLLNNSIDALKASTGNEHKIQIRGSVKNGRAELIVTDQGIGIPPEELSKIQANGGSYNKSGGTGLGLTHAKKTIAVAEGQLKIDSTVGVGTTVTIDVPLVAPPAWCLEVLDLTGIEQLIVLDDDESVHVLWRQRLEGYSVKCAKHPDELTASSLSSESCKFLIDYDLGPEVTNGLELLKQWNLGAKAVLCTANFDDETLQADILLLGCKILPKNMISSVPILVGFPSSEQGEASNNSSKSSYDLVLIDDDPIVRELWDMDAARLGKRLLAVESLEGLNASEVDFNVPFYVDKNLGKGTPGLEVLKRLHDAGFENLILSTGESVKEADIPKFLKEVRGKAFPDNFI